MALELLSSYRKEIDGLELVPAGGGRFEISLNGEILFSKLETGRFPELKELKASIDRKRADDSVTRHSP